MKPLLLHLVLLSVYGQMFAQTCPPDVQPSCPRVTTVTVEQVNIGVDLDSFNIKIYYETGTANNAGLQWEAYLNNPLCADGYSFPSTNCIVVNSSNPSGVIEEIKYGRSGDIAYVTSSGRTNPNCGGNTCNKELSQATSILPVEFLSFTAQEENSAIRLQWSTASESNNVGFEIEKKDLQNNWNTLGFVEGSYNSSTVQNYYFIDPKIESHKSYYRLKQLDQDGKTNYSRIIHINTTLQSSNLKIYPNPSSGQSQLEINLDYDQSVNIQIVNPIGQVVLSSTHQLLAEQNTVPLDLSTLKSDFYLARIELEDEVVTQSIIINR